MHSPLNSTATSPGNAPNFAWLPIVSTEPDPGCGIPGCGHCDVVPWEWSRCCGSPMPQDGVRRTMTMTKKRRRHTPEQIIRKLAEGNKLLAGGMDLEEVCRRFEIAESTWHRWVAQYGG